MIRVGIIGCGKIAQVRHLPEYAANPNAEIVAFYDKNMERAQEMAYIRSGDDGDCQRFWEIWTAKEALFKLTGKGPLLALSRFSLPAGVTLDYTAQKGCALTIAAQIL